MSQACDSYMSIPLVSSSFLELWKIVCLLYNDTTLVTFFSTYP